MVQTKPHSPSPCAHMHMDFHECHISLTINHIKKDAKPILHFIVMNSQFLSHIPISKWNCLFKISTNALEIYKYNGKYYFRHVDLANFLSEGNI